MFIPFIENSFKHGLNTQISHGYVHIFMEVEANDVHLYIENSKSESLPLQDHSRPSGGIGLVNVRRRLNLLYPDRYEFEIIDEPHRYAIDLKIELD